MDHGDGTCPDVCPGWLARLPQMNEARQTVWALRKNALSMYCPDPPAVLLEAARVLDESYDVYEAKRAADRANAP